MLDASSTDTSRAVKGCHGVVLRMRVRPTCSMVVPLGIQRCSPYRLAVNDAVFKPWIKRSGHGLIDELKSRRRRSGPLSRLVVSLGMDIKSVYACPGVDSTDPCTF